MNEMLLEIKAGQLAALGTAICWTFTALCFEYSSPKIGSLSVNLIKMYLAFLLFTVFAWIFRGKPFPTDASGFAWLWLGLSGIIGFVLGDLFLFNAFAMIGARTSMLIMALIRPGLVNRESRIVNRAFPCCAIRLKPDVTLIFEAEIRVIFYF